MTNASTTQRLDVPAAGSYRLDTGRSAISFRTRHLFGLAAVSGRMQLSGGEVVIDPATPKASVVATALAGSFSSGHGKRDGDVRSAKFLNVAAYPEFTFQAGKLAQTGSGWSLAGQLTVRGVTQPVTFLIDSVETTGGGFRAHATSRIDRYAFGLTAAKGMAARFLDVELTVVAEPVR